MIRRDALLVRSGRIDYREAWELQLRMVAARAREDIPDLIWLLEHPPTFTTGRHGTREDLRLPPGELERRGGVFLRVDRGGQMTWHGPGQTTGYVIHDLRGRRRVRPFVAALVDAMHTAAGIGDAVADHRRNGLYRRGRKLGSVGIRVGGGITYHGIGLNRDPDLEWSRSMIGCGDPDAPPTSIAAEGGNADRARVEEALAETLADRLELDLRPAALEALPLPPAEGVELHQ